MKTLITAILITLMGTPLLAQLENIPLITVMGESAIKVKPDYVILGLKVNKEIRLNTQIDPTVFEIFKDEDIKVRLFDFKDDDISYGLTQMDSSLYVKEIFITINKIEKLDKYLLELYKLGYKDYIYMDYRIKRFKVYKNQARKEAISSAKKKASLLAADLGQTIGKAHSIEEVFSEDYNWYNIHNNDNLENITFKLGAEGYVVEPGYIMITSKLKISFDLLK